MSINPNWMRGPKEKSSHLEDNENHVCDTAYVSSKDNIEKPLPKLPKLEGVREFVESMVEEIILEGKSFESYKDELKRQCKEEGVDYENLVYGLEDFIEEVITPLAQKQGRREGRMGVTLVRKPNGDLFFIDKKGNRVPNENVPGHFETIEHEERDPDRLHVYYCFIFDSGEIFVYGEDTYSYSGHSFCEHNAFYPSRRELFDSL